MFPPDMLLSLLRRGQAPAGPGRGVPPPRQAPLRPVDTGVEMDPLLGGTGGPLGRVPMGDASLSPPRVPRVPAVEMALASRPQMRPPAPQSPLSDPYEQVGAPPVPRGFDPAPQRDLRAESGPMGKASLMAMLFGLLSGGGRGALAAGVGAGQGYMQGAQAGHEGRLDSWQRDAQVRQWEDRNARQAWEDRFGIAQAQQRAQAMEAERQRRVQADQDDAAMRAWTKQVDAAIAQEAQQSREDIARMQDRRAGEGQRLTDERERNAQALREPFLAAQTDLMGQRARGYAGEQAAKAAAERRWLDIAARNAATNAKRAAEASQTARMNAQTAAQRQKAQEAERVQARREKQRAERERRGQRIDGLLADVAAIEQSRTRQEKVPMLDEYGDALPGQYRLKTIYEKPPAEATAKARQKLKAAREEAARNGEEIVREPDGTYTRRKVFYDAKGRRKSVPAPGRANL